MGSLYQPKLKSGELCQIFWLKYYVNGRCVRESSGTDNLRAAEKMLKEREGRVVTGQPILPRAHKVTYQEIRDDLRRYYLTTGERELVEVDKRLKHLDGFFSTYRAVAIDRAAIIRYIEGRQARDANGAATQLSAANGTINREVTMLGTMLRHAVANNKLVRLPDLRKIKLKEADPRSGFFEEEQFEWVRKRLSEDLQAAVSVAYTYGWRMQSEVLSLEQRHLDLEAGTLTLDPAMTKNGKGRIVYLTPELKSLLAAQVERVEALEKTLGRIIPRLFPHLPLVRTRKGVLTEPHVNPRLIGTQRRDFRKAWVTACKLAGVPGKLRHDFRRTAARNLIRRGVPERVAMTVTGHLTRSVFDRYNIVSVADSQEAARRPSDDGHVAPHDAARGHVFGHVRKNPAV